MFLGWSGNAASLENPMVITVSSNRTIFANFTKQPKLTVTATPELLHSAGLRLTASGDPDETYHLESSTNLVNWLFLTSVTNTFGTAQFTDTAATNTPRLFYRAKRIE